MLAWLSFVQILHLLFIVWWLPFFLYHQSTKVLWSGHLILRSGSALLLATMVNSHIFIAPSNQVCRLLLLHPAHMIFPRHIISNSMLSHCLYLARQIGPWYPLTNSVLDKHWLQPYVHDCVMQIHKGNQIHQLQVFFKWHRCLQYNKSLPFLQWCTVAQGDFVVMWMGVYPNSVVNMWGCDPKISDWVIGRYVLWEYM